jgi:hypothetical protein
VANQNALLHTGAFANSVDTTYSQFEVVNGATGALMCFVCSALR